jgi:DNA primase
MTSVSGIIPKEIVEQIRQACDVVDVIETYVPLKKAGARFKACCPFHKEKTPSFNVDPSRQMFKCFGCGVGGDIFKFVQLYENLDFPGAVRRLASRAHIDIPETSGPVDLQEKSQRERLFQLHSAAAAWWAQLLRKDPAGEPARAYLKSRQINSDLAREFGLGYAPAGWTETMDWAKAQGFGHELLDAAGLTTVNESGRRYDRFRGRLMFPIGNETGQVVAFSGRLLDAEAKAAKYVNSPETLIFTKGKILFGLEKTKRAILDQRTAVVCEGQIDLMRCYERGIQNVVAPQGTAFTEHHARLLKRYADEVILCFDADRAGQNAAERSVDILLQGGLTVRIAQMPAGEDPDTLLLRNDKAVLEKILQAAPDYLKFLLDAACREHDVQSPKGRSLASAKMAAVVSKIANPVQKQTVSEDVARRLQIPLSLFEQELAKVKSVRPAQDEPEKESAGEESLAVSPAVEALLSLLLHEPDLIPAVQRRLNGQWLEAVEGSTLLQRLLDAHTHEEWENAEHFARTGSDAEKSFLAGLLVNPHPVAPEIRREDYAAELLLTLQKAWQRRRMQIVEQEIKSNLLNPNDLSLKLKELVDLQKTLP